MWDNYGRPEVAYEVSDIEKTLGDYAGEAFAKAFFDKYIYKSEMPDYKELLQQVGVVLSQDDSKAYLGASIKETEDGLLISRNTAKGSPAYTAGLDNGDLITTLNGSPVTSLDAFNSIIENSKPGDKLNIGFKSYLKDEKTEVKLAKDPAYSFSIDENAGKNQLKERENWLKTE